MTDYLLGIATACLSYIFIWSLLYLPKALKELRSFDAPPLLCKPRRKKVCKRKAKHGRWQLIKAFWHHKPRDLQSGFAIGAILYLIGLSCVAGGIMFGSFSQILISFNRMANQVMMKGDLNGAATTLMANSTLSSNAMLLCPPRSTHETSGALCDLAPIKLMQFSDVAAADQVHLPKNYTMAGQTGSPTEIGVFAAGAGLKQLDPFGHFYIYCRWENSRSSPALPAIVILSAGPSGTLQTYCGDNAPRGDNGYYFINVANAIERSALWESKDNNAVQYGAVGSQVTVGADGSVNAQSLLMANSATFNGDVIAGAGIYNTVSPSNYSTAFGWMSGGLSAQGNSAFGVSALQHNTTGDMNAAFGAWALQNNTSGELLSAFGYGALASNTSGDWNTAMGQNALNLNTTGRSNAAFGQRALELNTTGEANIAVGAGALNANTTGSWNTAVGDWALSSNTAGNSNEAFGASSLIKNTSGSNNDAFGDSALFNNTTGHTNNAFGDSALYSNTSGYDNEAFGDWALHGNSTGYGNSAFGSGAIAQNTTGSLNSAFGAYVMSQLTTGSYNTAFGHNAAKNTNNDWNAAFGTAALLSNTSGDNNAMFGSGAGYNITTGGSNTCLGSNVCSSTLTTGSGNIIIGNNWFQADTLAAATSGYLNIGNTIYGWIEAAQIGIGTTNPVAKLDVNGGVKIGSSSDSCNSTDVLPEN